MHLISEVHQTLHEIVALQPNTSELALLAAGLLLEQSSTSSSSGIGSLIDPTTIATAEVLKTALHQTVASRLGCMETTLNRLQAVESRIRQTARLHQEVSCAKMRKKSKISGKKDPKF